MRLFHQFYPLVHVVAVLPVAKINRNKDRGADDDHDEPVVLQRKVSEAGDGTRGQGNRRGPGQIFLPGAEEIRSTTQGKELRQ